MSAQVSLKTRLLGTVLAVISLIWGGAAITTYIDASNELDEVFDAHLAQAASLLVVQATHEMDEIKTEHASVMHKYAQQVAFQVWERNRILRLHSANAPEQPLADTDHGFSTRTIGNQTWRVFSTWDESGKYLIHVAERTEARSYLAREVASHMLVPLLIALPLLALLLWLAITRALGPLVNLAHDVEQLAPGALTPLDASLAPVEARPLVERLNWLFTRIRDAIENERRFTADAAHELRTPVAAIKAQAQVARGATDTQARMHALDNAIAGCDRATHLIEQLLTLARLDATLPQSTADCNLRALAIDIMSEMAPQALDRNVQLDLAEGPELQVPGRPELLRILLRNLLDNAIRHTQAGTEVRVTVAMFENMPAIVVEDNGAGLPPEALDQLSQRFYRPLGTTASGSGLGLSIVRRIAEIHHAHLRFASGEHGRGLQASVIFRKPDAVQ